MEGIEALQTATPTAAAESASDTGSSYGDGDYTVSESELAELGIKMDSTKVDLTALNGDPRDKHGQKIADKGKTPKADKKNADVKPKEQSIDLSGSESDEESSEDQELKELLKSELGLGDEESDAEATPDSEMDEIELVVDGMKHKFPFQKIKDLAQMGMDYTQKTQALAQDNQKLQAGIKSFEKSQSEWIQQHEGRLYELDQITAFMEHLAGSQPEFYQNIETLAKQFAAQSRNPVMERQLSEERKRNSARDEQIEKVLLRLDSQSLKHDLRDLRDWHSTKFKAVFDRAGLKLDEKAIIDEWTHTGDDLRNIYKRLYSDKLMSLIQSQKTLANVKNMKTRQVPTAGKPRPYAVPEVKPKRVGQKNHQDTANDIIRQLGLTGG